MNTAEIDLPVRKRLRQFIVANKYVLRDVARKSGIAEKKFYKLLDGTCRLTADDLKRICSEGLGVNPSIFFDDKVSETEN